MNISALPVSRWLALLLALLGLFGTASAQTENFDVSPTRVEVGQPVTATYYADTGRQSLVIDWGDGNRDTLPGVRGSAIHRYSGAGSYTAALLVDNRAARRETITVTEATACEITAEPNPAAPGQSVSITVRFTGPAGSKYGIDFGDGSTDNFGAPGSDKSVSFKHAYSQSGAKVVVLLDLANQRPLCRLVVNVASPTPTLSLDPSPANVGQTVTATLGNLLAGAAYTLDWGDGTTVPATGSPKHAYGAPGVYVVSLSVPGAAPVTASITVRAPAPTLSVEPNPANVGQTVTASLDNLLPNLPYTLDWGDGTAVPVAGSAKASAKHAYSAPGVYVVKLSADGVAPVTVSVTVRPPAAGLSVDPNPATVEQEVTASMSGLLASLPYSLDWGDGSVVPVTGNGKATAKHKYAAPGVYVVKLSADGVAPVTVSVTVRPPAAGLSVEPNPATVGQNVTAVASSLLPSLRYTLDWGDGSVVPVSGNGSASARHAYALPGVFVVTLSADGVAPVSVSVTVRPPVPTLNVDPNPATVGQDVTASMSSLLASLPYSLDWGDGSVVPVTGNGTATAKHKYAAPGMFIIKLSADGVAPITVSLTVRPPVPTLSVNPNPAEVGQSVTATLGNLLASLPYSLDWGDGSVVPATGSPKHTYAAPGVYVVKVSADGVTPVALSLTVKVPVPTLSAAPNPARVSENVTATPGNLAPGLSYTLDWGDGTSSAITGPLKHAYGAPGMYVLKLSVEGAAPATATVRVEASLSAQSLTLRLTRPQDAVNPKVLRGSRVDAALTLEYAGQGQLTGELQLDGQTLANVNLNAVRGKTLVSFPVPNLPTAELGVHTLTYVPAPAEGEAPMPSTPPAVTYMVLPVPTELEINGFIFKITALKNPDFAAFEGTATHTLIVGGVEAFRDVSVTFSKLTVVSVSDERVRVTDGQIIMGLSAFKATPLPAGLGGFKLIPASVKFTPVSADFSGQVSLAITCEPPVKPNFGDRQTWLESHPGLLDLVSTGPEKFVINPIAELDRKGMLPVFAAPINLRGQGTGTVLIRTASTRSTRDTLAQNTLAQAGAGGLSAANGLGHSQDFRFATLQGNAALASAVSASAVLAEATKYCRPDPKFTYAMTAALKPGSGDLYGSASASMTSLPVPKTPMTLTGSADMTLDLSASQTADTVAGVLPLYDTQPGIVKPPGGDAWMGLVLDKVQPGFGTARMPPTTATLRSGYTFGGGLGAGDFTDRGWTFKLSDLSLTTVENILGDTEGTATINIPLFETRADVALTVTAGGLHYALKGALKRDFGKSDLASGGGAWVERGQNLDLQITATSWDLKELSTLKPGQQGGGIKAGTRLGDYASSVSGGVKYVGNVPAVQGGQSVSSAISSAVNTGASTLIKTMLGTVSPSAGGSSSSGGAATGSGNFNSAQFVDPSGAVRASGVAGNILILPSASLEDGVATLNTLTLTADGNVRFGESALAAASQKKSADGLSRVALSSPDFKLLGQTFNVTGAVIGRAGNRYALGLDGLQKLSSQTPSVKTQMRYHVSGGRNLDLSLRTDAFSKQIDPNATFRVDASEVFVALNGTGMVSSSPVQASLGAISQSGSLGLKAVAGGYELTIAGGLDTGSGASVMKVTAEALFGLTDDPYFYVKAAIDSRSPIVSVLGAFNLYGFTGGVAYNMKWPDNATIPQYAQRPAKAGDHRVQIIGGITAAFEDGNSLHFKAIFKIDTQRGFELTADGWILTPLNQGVFGSQAAQSRILISVTGDGFDMLGCLGPQYIDKLNCNDLRKFTLASVVDITAWLHVRIADQKFVKIGTYSNPISAKLNIPVLGGVESRGYLIFGQALENGDRKGDLKGTGLFTGYAFDARFGVAGSLGRIGWPFKCYPWGRASLGYGMNIDVGLQINPVSFDAAAGFHADLDVRAGCAGRDTPFPNKQAIMDWKGKSIGLTIGADISGHLRAFDPIAFDGTAKLHVDIPVIPTFDISANVSF